MMTLKHTIALALTFITFFGYTQNMKEGFTYLETGKYKQAEIFFKSVLAEYPNNKTAKLCYGRAVGLNGNAKQAVSIFTSLLDTYPNDFEIQLNYAEGLLWNKNYTEAKNYYNTLVTKNSTSFPALLGYANTLSNLKVYDEALEYVTKALAVSPENANALISKKYIQLGYANQYIQTQDYDKALSLLQNNLTFFKDDKDTYLNIANIYLITNALDKAKTTYQNIAVTDSITALNGLALVSHLKGKDKAALKLSAKAFSSIEEQTDTTIINQTKERYIQALIWNKKYTTAKKLIDTLLVTHPNENWVLSLQATLNIYKSNFKESIANYNAILKNDSLSFDGNLGKANAQKAAGLFDAAYASADKTLSIFKNQKDATQFLKTLDKQFTPFIETKAAYTFDNGDNEAVYLQTNAEYALSSKFKLLGYYNHRNTTNAVTNTKATSNAAGFGLSYQLLPTITVKGTLGLTSAQANTNNYTQLLTDIAFVIKPFKLQVLDLGYKRELQNFNAELLDREIVQNHFYANYNLSTNFNLGWFTQYYFTAQNDDNNRNLLFTSLYYNILTKPGLKTGLNYQYITFKNQVPTIYFSPEQFNAAEVFIELIKDEKITKPKAWFYQLTAATGLQSIEGNNSQSTYRFQGKLGYKFSERSLANIYGTHSNIASATAAGFRFTEIGIRFKWFLLDGPRFRK
jgi:predicted Zn-dependent protease